MYNTHSVSLYNQSWNKGVLLQVALWQETPFGCCSLTYLKTGADVA